MSDSSVTKCGLKVEGPAENERNADSRELFKAMIREVYGADDCIVAHHLTYVAVERCGGFDYQVVEEIPSADTLIFDVEAAKKIWGPLWERILTRLAVTPVPERDALLRQLYYGRTK